MNSTKHGAALRREYERMLQSAGASKRSRVDVASILHPEVIARVLPLWRRVRVAVMR